MSAFVQSPAFQPDRASAAGRRRIALPLLGIVAALVLALLAVEMAVPAPTLALSKYAARCDGAAIRTKPSTTSTKLTALSKGDTVIAVDRITGGAWKTVCAGTTARGSTWLKITIVKGKTATSRWGRTYVYAATSLFKRLYTMTELKTACDGVRLRTSASTTATRKATLSAGTKVISIGTVSGGGYSTTCAGKAVSGTSWVRINSVNGKSVQSLYGVSYVYAAKGLFVSAATESAAGQATPAPTATPTPTPTPTPTATPAPSATASPSPSPTSSYIEGIDVSHWQGVIDWAKVKAAGKKFAFIKASEHTTFVDDMYATNRAQAKANGILVGAYHFARPDTTSGDGVAEADHFIDVAAPVKGEMLPVLDLEVSGGLTVSQLQGWVKSFMDRVYARTGVKGAIYVSPSFWSNYMGNSTSFATAGYKTLWVAHWTTASAPTVPANNWGGNGWTFWQYTSSGTVNGIGGRVDLDRYRYTDFTRVLIP